MRFGDLTYEEIRDRSATSLAVIPTGCTEQQGPHLPVDVDSWFAEQVCLAAAEAAEAHGCGVLVLATMPFGPTPEHRSFSTGHIDIPKNLHEEAFGCRLGSLASQGFRKLVIWRGCGRHDRQAVVDAFNDRHGNSVRAFLPSLSYHDIWCRIGDPSVPGGHADSFTTSVSLFLRPESVRQDRIRDPKSKQVDWSVDDLDFFDHSETGVIGDPTKSSAELGERLWREIVSEVSSIFEALGRRAGRADSQQLTNLTAEVGI